MTGRPRGRLAARMAVVTFAVFGMQFLLLVALQIAFARMVREVAVDQVVLALDDLGALEGCESRPGPWHHRDGWWTAWPIDREGRVLGEDAPIRTVELPPAKALARTTSPAGVVYAVSTPGCAGVAFVERTPYSAAREMSGALFLFSLGRVSLMLLGGVVIVAVTAWPLVRRIRALAERVRGVVDRGFEGSVRDGSDDELGELAEAFDAATAVARERLRRLEARDDVLRRALADLAHDLRTPLTTLQLSASSLPASEAASAIRSELTFLGGMAQNFESFLGGDELGVQEVVDLVPLVERLHHRFAPLARDGALAFAVALPDESPKALADPVALERAVGNLVQNAMRWAAGHVAVLLFVEGREVRIEVRDDGPGLGNGSLPVPRRGVRGPNARGEGFGLGLAIAEAAARRFRGRLELGNGATGGTVAAIVLPLG